MGRVDVVVVDKDTALATWIEPNGETASLMIATVKSDGSVEDLKVVAQVSASRSSGFPRIANVGGGVLFAWTALDRKQGIATTFLK